MNEHRIRFPVRLERDAGVSLIDLLLAISITAIIIVALVGAMFFGFRTTGDTQTRLLESGKAGLLQSYFVPDVENAVTIQKSATESAAACGTPRAAAVNLLLTAADGSSVSYYRGSLAGENTNYLYRRTCVGGSAVTVRVISNLASTPTFNCRPTLDCVTNPWTSITATLTQQDAQGKNQYSTTVQAAKRVT